MAFDNLSKVQNYWVKKFESLSVFYTFCFALPNHSIWQNEKRVCVCVCVWRIGEANIIQKNREGWGGSQSALAPQLQRFGNMPARAYRGHRPHSDSLVSEAVSATIQREFEELGVQNHRQQLHLKITVVLKCKKLKMILLVPA